MAAPKLMGSSAGGQQLSTSNAGSDGAYHGRQQSVPLDASIGKGTHPGRGDS